MSLHRRNPRRDHHEAQIVAALRRCGCYVYRLSGRGLPDLLVGQRGQWWLAEVKGPRQPLTRAQQSFHDNAFFAGLRTEILRSIDDAIEAATGQIR
jgi:hypothetical protein